MGLQIRGMALATARAFAKEAAKQDGWKQLHADLPEAHRPIWDGLILPTGWYDADVFDSFLNVIDWRLRSRIPDLGQQLGARIARGNIKFYHSFLLPFLNPGTVLTQSATLWREYFNEGAMRVVDEEEKSRKLVLENPGVHKLICEEVVVGWGRVAIEGTGSKVRRLDHVACVRNGAKRCEYQAEWL